MIKFGVLFILYVCGISSASVALYWLVYTDKPVIFCGLQLLFSISLIFTAFFLKPDMKKERVELLLSGKLSIYIMVYALFLPFTGYLLSTTIFAYLLNRDHSLLWTDCLLTALITSITSYVIFKYLLIFTPELGWLFTLIGQRIW